MTCVWMQCTLMAAVLSTAMPACLDARTDNPPSAGQQGNAIVVGGGPGSCDFVLQASVVTGDRQDVGLKIGSSLHTRQTRGYAEIARQTLPISASGKAFSMLIDVVTISTGRQLFSFKWGPPGLFPGIVEETDFVDICPEIRQAFDSKVTRNDVAGGKYIVQNYYHVPRPDSGIPAVSH